MVFGIRLHKAELGYVNNKSTKKKTTNSSKKGFFFNVWNYNLQLKSKTDPFELVTRKQTTLSLT